MSNVSCKGDLYIDYEASASQSLQPSHAQQYYQRSISFPTCRSESPPSYTLQTAAERPVVVPQQRPFATAPFFPAYAPSLRDHGIAPATWHQFMASMNEAVGTVPSRLGPGARPRALAPPPDPVCVGGHVDVLIPQPQRQRQRERGHGEDIAPSWRVPEDPARGARHRHPRRGQHRVVPSPGPARRHDGHDRARGPARYCGWREQRRPPGHCAEPADRGRETEAG
ncbi:hypothetical protein PG987_009883 [Apiospora arundinis]